MSNSFVPAAGKRAFTRLYDPVMRLSMREPAWRPMAIDRLASELTPGNLAVDVGAGTGTAAAMLAARAREARIVAIDVDPEVIQIGKAKTSAENISWQRGEASNLNLESGSVKGMLLSLVLHHLDREGKEATLSEIMRCLVPGGLLVICDWGKPDRLTTLPFLALRALDGFSNTADHANGNLSAMIENSGFTDVQKIKALNTVWGRLEVLTASRPS